MSNDKLRTICIIFSKFTTKQKQNLLKINSICTLKL